MAACYVCLCFCSYRQQHFHTLVFSLRSTLHADSASSCHPVSSHPWVPVFIPPAVSTCQLFVGSASLKAPQRTAVQGDSACQLFRLPREGGTAGTAWEAVDAAVNRPLVSRWRWSRLVWLYSLTGRGVLSLQSFFCFLLIVTKVGQARITQVLNTGRNTGKDYKSIQELSCPISGLRVWLPSAWSTETCVRRKLGRLLS